MRAAVASPCSTNGRSSDGAGPVRARALPRADRALRSRWRPGFGLQRDRRRQTSADRRPCPQASPRLRHRGRGASRTDQAADDTTFEPGPARAFQFRATRMERYIVAATRRRGPLPPHRDNTRPRHRIARFAGDDQPQRPESMKRRPSLPRIWPAHLRAPTRQRSSSPAPCSMSDAGDVGRRFAFLPSLRRGRRADRERNSPPLAEGPASIGKIRPQRA